MTAFDADYFDGKSSARVPVRVSVLADCLHVEGNAVDFTAPLLAVSVDPPVSGIRRAIHLPDGGQIQTDDDAAVMELFPRVGRLETWVDAVERRWRPASIALLLVIAISAWCAIYGLPLAAKLVAGVVPIGMEAKLGAQALASIDASLCRPTKLDALRQQSVREAFGTLTAGLDGDDRFKLEMRACRGIGPNAFALPGGAIVVTDQLVDLAQNDAQLSAVLAHELGHVRHRHALRQTLQAAGAAALISTLAGDAVSIASIAVALPTVLLQTGYSREFEDEADTYAFERLKQIGRSPKDFAEIIGRIEEFHAKATGTKSGSGERTFDYLSTHPATARRIQRALENQ